MMKTANFPRRAVELGLPRKIGDGDWLISITDCDGEHVTPKDHFQHAMYVAFDDVNEPGERSITPEQGERIARFINDARTARASVWVNCHAGICRSGAVVRILVELGWEYQAIFSPPGIPNALVYQTIRQHFDELKYSWEK